MFHEAPTHGLQLMCSVRRQTNIRDMKFSRAMSIISLFVVWVWWPSKISKVRSFFDGLILDTKWLNYSVKRLAWIQPDEWHLAIEPALSAADNAPTYLFLRRPMTRKFLLQTTLRPDSSTLNTLPGGQLCFRNWASSKLKRLFTACLLNRLAREIDVVEGIFVT